MTDGRWSVCFRAETCGEHRFTGEQVSVGTSIFDSTTEGLPAGAPPDTLGVDGDVYIDFHAGQFRRKANGTWA